MQQSVRYKGLSLTPDEMAVENGALSLCGNLELHDGALRPTIVSGTELPNTIMVDNPGDTKVLYIHETGNYRHFIGLHQESEEELKYSLHWFDEEGAYMDTLHVFTTGASVKSVNSVGNTLVVISSEGIFYALFHVGDNYEWLGQKPPFVELGFVTSMTDQFEDYDLGGIEADGSKNGFNLCFQQTTYACGDIFKKVDETHWNKGNLCVNIVEDKQSDITQSIYALVNRTNNLIARHGRFYANFFIRYCYRMFDGSMVMHSSPVFIPVQVPDNYCVKSANIWFDQNKLDDGDDATGSIKWEDQVSFDRKDSKGTSIKVKITKATFMYSPRNVELLYSLNGDVETLRKWGDIIKSVDIFITPPITNIDTSEKISRLKIYTDNYGIARGLTDSCFWTKTTAGWILGQGASIVKQVLGWASIDFPTISEDAYANKLKNTAAFYKVASLKVSELKEIYGAESVPIDKGVVYQVSLQEQMKDDYKTHNLLYADGSYVYNHRLNLFGMSEKLFNGFSRQVMFPATNMFLSSSFEDPVSIVKIVTVLNTTSGKKYVESGIGTVFNKIEPQMITNLVKFYPDSRAEKMVFFTYNNYKGDRIYSFDLEECEELNGAIHMGNFKDDPSKYIVDSFEYTVDDVVEMQNKLYTSEADNAFYFPLNGINTVGTGKILGVAATTRPISPGQFGQFPLMAFSTDGIWTLSVSSTGTYSGINSLSREICSNIKSIAQLDQSVTFVTSRSLSRVVEGSVVSMTDVLDGPYFKISQNMGKIARFFDDADSDTDETRSIKRQMRQLIEFSDSPIDFLQNCQVVYDYKNSRIFCIDVGQDKRDATTDAIALSYSMRDGTWSTFIIKNVLTAINHYPHPYIQYRDGRMVCLDKGYGYEDGGIRHGIIVTRTLKFDEDALPNAITGYSHSLMTSMAPILWVYGSNDNQNWHYLGRCGTMKSHYMPGKGYRFFRIAIYLQMKPYQQYFATLLEIIRRFGKF